MRKVYETGKGPVKIRAKYVYDETENCVEVIEIPYSTSIEAIKKEILDLVKEGKVKEITEVRDEIDKDGFKLAIDLKKGSDPDAVMQKLYKFTPLEDSFACNFNVLIDGVPKQLGVKEILVEWIRFRTGCLRREFYFDLEKKKAKRHLLRGLRKILLDIDKAISIVRDTEKDCDVVPNLMVGFDIDKDQAEYIAEIKLRHLNREYIANRIEEIMALDEEIAELTDLLYDEIKMKQYIIKQLTAIKKKYGQPRRTDVIEATEIKDFDKELMIEDYQAFLFFTKDGYLKKITQQSLRGNAEQKLKEDDEIILECEISNKDEVIFFTDKAQLYFAKMSDFELTKASEIGIYVPKKLNFDPDERVISMKINPVFTEENRVIFFYENGKAVRVPMDQYATQGNRKKLKKAFSDASPVVSVIYEEDDNYIMLINSEHKAILVRPSLIPIKTTRTSIGTIVFAMNLKKNQKITQVIKDYESKYPEANSNYRKLKIPATGVLMLDKDIRSKQLKIK